MKRNIKLVITATAFMLNSGLALNSAYADVKVDPVNEAAIVETETRMGESKHVDFGELAGIERYRINCNLGSDDRQIKVIAQNDDSVGVTYEKFDEVKTVALAKEVPAYADQVAERIKSNLQNSGFKCENSKADVGGDNKAS